MTQTVINAQESVAFRVDQIEENPVESGGIELEGIKKTGLGLTNPDFVTACLEGFEPPTFWFVAKHS